VPAQPGPGGPTISVDDPAALDRASGVLQGGGTVVLPTDTVYGLAALPSVPGATDALFALKGRSSDQPLAVLVADADAALALVEPVGSTVHRWMAERWPGPLTLVLRRAPAAAGLALGSGVDTIGIRCPDHDFVRALAAEVGPIATTSANRHGESTPRSAAKAAAALTGPVGLIIDGGPAGTVASTVVDASVERWRVLRVGAVAPDLLA
jgi:tRNA threonylcarbamoyl adenosine modification protein (Sua5/YciO/YrdC/YwlC family)